MSENTTAEIYANVRNKALEEAAMICDDSACGDMQTTAHAAAAKIRTLKTPEAE